MDFEQRYCVHCKKVTTHTKEKDNTGFERIFLSIITLGFNEMINNTTYTCVECGKRTIK